jgi:hypothetical protein
MLNKAFIQHTSAAHKQHGIETVYTKALDTYLHIIVREPG